MDSSAQLDRLSNLPDVLLILIISRLHFKDCVMTSILSKRWRSLYRETRNVAFRESDFVDTSSYGERRVNARMAFVEYMCRWVARIHDQPIDSFEICIAYPFAYLNEIRDLIEFACRKRVKNLVLDFSEPAWRTLHDLQRHAHRVFVVEVPESVYLLRTLESLKVCACQMFDPSRFWHPEKFKSLSFGWMGLPNLEPLLSETPRLESLSINDCWGIDANKIAGDMRELAFKNCHFLFFGCTFDLPRVDVFKYTGNTCYLKFQRMNTVIKEVHLDFGVLDESDELRESINEEAGILCDILNDLRSARTLTVSPYLLQMIQRSKDPTHLLHPVETQHLVLKTTLHPKDFNGIRLLLDNCPDLETFTLDLLPRNSIVTTSSYAGIDPRTYWMQNITYNCLRKTLKAVVIKNFVGGLNELNVLRYLIRSGGEHEPVLERIELYVPYWFEYSQKMFAYEGAEMLQRSSEHVQVSCAQFLKR